MGGKAASTTGIEEIVEGYVTFPPFYHSVAGINENLEQEEENTTVATSQLVAAEGASMI